MIVARGLAIVLGVGLLAAAGGSLADDGIAAVGRINGQALACGHGDVAASAGRAVIARVARTRENGEAFERATQEAFLAQQDGICPSRAELAVGLEVALLAMPAMGDSTAASPPPVHATPELPGGADAQPVNPLFLLQDMHGRAIDHEDFPGRFRLLTFGYTFCPDVCPTTLADMATILRRLGEDATRLQAIFVSVDPGRDTAAVLRSYTAFFDARILGASGSPAMLRRAAESFGVRFARADAEDASVPYAVDHSAGMFLVAPDGELVARFAYASPVDTVIERIVAELAARPAGEELNR